MFASRRAILHVDMDAFFASVEQARRPGLRGRPVVVGGPRGGRGVVSACSYEARAFGVRSAMPLREAERLCPQAVFLPVDMAAYLAVHHDLVALFRTWTDQVEVASIDEAYLDVTGSRRAFGPPRAIASRLQEQVYERHGITCSVGIGPTKPLAKLAAGLRKPAGLAELTFADVRGRLRELPVTALAGVGPVTAGRLAGLGITTVGMLQDAPLALLAAAFGREACHLRQLALGRSVSPLRAVPPLPRSVGRETTFAEDTDDSGLLRATLLALTDRAVADLRRHGLAARAVTVTLRFSDFRTVSRRRTVARPLASTRPRFAVAAALLAGVDRGDGRVRLLGVSLGSLCHGGRQLALDDGWREAALDEAVDRVRGRFGGGAVRRAGALLAPV